MNFLEKVLNRFNGLDYRQEYLCLASDSFSQPLHLYLVYEGRVIKDITKHHSFVGYAPLIFAFSTNDLPASAGALEIIFSQDSLEINEVFNKKDAIAGIRFKQIHQNFLNNIVLLYEGVRGYHRFLNGFHQGIIKLNNRLFGKKPGNVFLEGNLYQQVQIAYSVPRKICLITVGGDNLFNLFPTDLHGDINGQHYMISLRHQGRACGQVEQFKKILLSDMDALCYKDVYARGKNHMQPLRSSQEFDFSENRSQEFDLPIPKACIAYKELELQDSVIQGIHRLLLFKIVNRQTLIKGGALEHIHNSYATWRNNKGLQGNYLLR
jgi:hypothetical protein